MSLHPRDFSVIPEETTRVARAAFPKGNPYMTLRDELGVIYEDHAFALVTQTKKLPFRHGYGFNDLALILAEGIVQRNGNAVSILVTSIRPLGRCHP